MKRPTQAIAGAVWLALVVVGGCGDGDGDDPASPVVTSAAATPVDTADGSSEPLVTTAAVTTTHPDTTDIEVSGSDGAAPTGSDSPADAEDPADADGRADAENPTDADAGDQRDGEDPADGEVPADIEVSGSDGAAPTGSDPPTDAEEPKDAEGPAQAEDRTDAYGAVQAEGRTDAESPVDADAGAVEVVFEISETAAPEWPFRGAVRLDYGTSRLDFHDARDGSLTSIDLMGFARAVCQWTTMVWDEHSVRVEVEGPYSRRDIIEIPWGEPGSLKAEGSQIDWPAINTASNYYREFQAGEIEIRLIRQSFGLVLEVGGESAGYYISGTPGVLGAVYTPEGELEGAAADDWVNEWANSITESPLQEESFWISGLLGTDGELIGFSARPFEPACISPMPFLVSLRTGELIACSEFSLAEIMLVHPRGEDLFVDEVRLPPPGWLNNEGSPCVDNSGEIDLSALYQALTN